MNAFGSYAHYGEVQQGKPAEWELWLQLLRNKDRGVQARASQKLRLYVETAVREMSTETFNKFEGELHRCVFALVHSQDMADKLAGVAAIDALIGASSPQAEQKIVSFSSNLTHALRTSTDLVLLQHASRAIGHMARSHVAPNADYVEFEVTRGLEWLHAEQWHRRLAACLVLKELAHHAPTALYSKARSFFARVPPVLRDLRQAVREAAAEALHACLQIMSRRRSRYHLNWMSVYHRETAPLIHHYEEEGLLVHFPVKKGIKDADALLAAMLQQQQQHQR